MLSVRRDNPTKDPNGLIAHIFLFLGVFLDIQLFLCALFSFQTRAYETTARFFSLLAFLLLILCFFFFMRLKRQQVEIYREAGMVLYIGTMLALPLAQWLCYFFVYEDIFGYVGDYYHVGWIAVFIWECVLFFNLRTEVVNYDYNPNRKHWTCRLRRLFVASRRKY